MTKMDRRTVLKTTASMAAGLAALPAAARAGQADMKAPSNAQAPGYQRIRIGDATVTVLLDGYIDILPQWWLNTGPEDLAAALEGQFLDPEAPLRISVNAYVIEIGGRRIAIDAGADAFFGPKAGRWGSAFSAAGFAPEGVDTVLVSHMHPDHIGGLIAGDNAVFPQAEVMVNSLDLAYWTSEAEEARAPEFARPWYQAARDVTRLYDGRIQTFEGDASLLPGVTAVPLPGHTPGHSGFLIESEGDVLFLWTDVSDFLALQLNAPERTLVFDIDAVQGEASRRRAFDMAATERLQIGGAHIPFPGFGYVGEAAGQRRFVPSEWQYEL